MSFLLSEDKALREKLQGMTVTDQKADDAGAPRPVGVWFGQPDQEVRSQSYPYVTIDMIDISRDNAREVRGKVEASYLRPSNAPQDEDVIIDFPIPVNIDYQVTTYSRHPRHDRAIMAQLLGAKLPIRSGILLTDDNTVRRLDILDISKRDVTDQAKRLFINAITVRISSEIAPALFTTLTKVLEVQINDVAEEDEGGRPGNPYFSGLGPQTITA